MPAAQQSIPEILNMTGLRQGLAAIMRREPAKTSLGRHEIATRTDHREDLAPGQAVHLPVRPEHGLCLAG